MRLEYSWAAGLCCSVTLSPRCWARKGALIRFTCSSLAGPNRPASTADLSIAVSCWAISPSYRTVTPRNWPSARWVSSFPTTVAVCMYGATTA